MMMIYIGNMPVAENIRALRSRKGLALEKLADLAEMPRYTLWLIEERLLEDIDYLHLKAICGILSVTMEDITEGEF